MPRPIQLPDGRWVYAPSSPFGNFRPGSLFGRSSMSNYPSFDASDEEDDGTLLGSAWEGIKSMPSGALDILLSGAQAGIGVATPFGDLPIEKQLRWLASKRARERDPRYRDAFLPSVGTGLGQVAGLATLGRVPGYGRSLATLAGMGMGITDQVRRIAEYEQRTGKNVPWLKETAAHVAGAMIGFTETIPIEGLMFKAPAFKMIERIAAGVDPMIQPRMILGVAGAEAVQEASAQWLQAMSSKGLYDPNALQDLGAAMREDFKVGGAVGGLAELGKQLILGHRAKYGSLSLHDKLKEGALRRTRFLSRDVRDALGHDVANAIEPVGMQNELGKLLSESRIDSDLVEDMMDAYGGEWSSLPDGMERLLVDANVDQPTVQRIIEEFTLRTERLNEQLAQGREQATGQDSKEEFTRAQDILNVMSNKRLKVLHGSLEMLGYADRGGGLSDTEQYQKIKSNILKSFEGDPKVVDVALTRRQEIKEGKPQTTFTRIMQDIFGGAFGIRGFMRTSELLGVHGGIGSDQINIDAPEKNGVFPDINLSSSDAANYSLTDIGAIIFDDVMANQHGSLFVSEEAMEQIASFDKQIADLEEIRSQTWSKFPQLRQLADPSGKLSDEDWRVKREAHNQQIFNTRASVSDQLQARKQERNTLYLTSLHESLRQISRQGEPARDDLAKKLNLSVPDFDVWLARMSQTVARNYQKSQINIKEREAGGRKLQQYIQDMDDGERLNIEATIEPLLDKKYDIFADDMSAEDAINLSKIFSPWVETDGKFNEKESEKKRQAAIDHMFEIKAMSDISRWLVKYKLGVPIAGGVFYRDPSVNVVDSFINREKAKKNPAVTEADIKNLLESKNIFLRSATEGPAPIGDKIAKLSGGEGVNSRPFRRLLDDMTGALNWSEASDAQKLLMYSRLLQVSPMRGIRERGKWIGAQGKEYRPVYLPDFYEDRSVDAHLAPILDRITETAAYAGAMPARQARSRIDVLRERVQKALEADYNEDSFGEAVARLVETEVASLSPQSEVVLNPEKPDVAMPEFRMVSGGAKGSDFQWGEIGKKFGLSEDRIHHLWVDSPEVGEDRGITPHGNRPITQEQARAIDEEVKKANIFVGRVFPMQPKRGRTQAQTTRANNLLRRNWYQVRGSDAVFAIGNLDKKKTGLAVEGGTGWAVQMAIDQGKPVHFFDQKSNKWYTGNNTSLTEIDTPTLTPNFAGIGTRGITPAGRKAIEDVYKKTTAPQVYVDKDQIELALPEGPLPIDDRYLSLNPESPTNIEFDPRDDPFLSDEQKAWDEETDANRINIILQDKKYADSVDALVDAWNERNPDDKLSKKEYVKRFSDEIISGGGMQQLSEMGILDTVASSVRTRLKEQPTEIMLDMQTTEGTKIVNALIGVGAIPSSLRGGMQNLRSAYVDDLRTRFETIENIVEKELKGLRIPENVRVQFVDDIGGMFQTLSDVAMRGSITPREVAAMYDSVGNRIIINLAAVDPDNMLETSAIIRDSAFHEGLHSLFLRDYFLPAELETLRNYARNQVVPAEVDSQAHDHDLTWFQRAVVKYGDSNIPENDIEYESIISMLTELSRGNIPSAKSAGQMRKIREGMQGIMNTFIGASKEAQVEDVNQILADIESGRIADRGPGYTGESKFDAEVDRIRDNILSRYADPAELKELTRAIALRESAPSTAQRAVHQKMVEQIAGRITARKTEIQNSAPAAPNMVQNIEDERERAAITREEPSFAIPLMGNDTKINPEAYKEALNEFMRIRRGQVGYTMPAEYQAMFNQRSQGSSVLEELTADAVKRGLISDVDGDSTRKSLEKGALSGYGESGDKITGDTLEETQSNFSKSVSGLRYQYLDRRQWVKEQTDRIIAKQNRAQLDAETSALVAARQADNSVNYLRGLMLNGPLSYLGIGTGQGQFDNVPVFDEILAKQTGGDGRVKGLNDIFKPIMDPKDETKAMLYGVAKRILWTEGRRDTFRSMAEGIPRENLSSELRRSLDLFEKSYANITKGIKHTTGDLAKIINEVDNNNENQFIIDFWNNFSAYNRHHIKMSYNTGMITRSQRDEWLGMPWAPFYREMYKESDFAIGSAAELQKRGKNLMEKVLEGSREPITKELIDSIIKNTQAMVRDSMANVSVARVARDAVALNEGTKLGGISSLAGQVENRVVRVMEKGKAVFYRLNDEQLAMSSMMLGHNPRLQLKKLFGGEKTFTGEWGQKLTSGAATLIRESVTRTPPFIAKNIFRDGWQAMVITGGGPDLVLDAIRNAMTPDVLRRADELGLSIGIDFVAEPGQYVTKMKAELKRANPDWTNPLTPAASLWHFLGRMSKQSEVATRVAVYDRVLAKTGDKALAQYMAVEIMNYGRRGANPITGTILSTIPFINGRMQGLDVLARGVMGGERSSDIPGLDRYGLTSDEYQNLPFWKQSRGRLFSRGSTLMFATFVYYMLMRENEEWQDLRDEVKADNWLLPLGEHAWLKIPIPFEVGVMFKVIPEKIIEAMVEEDVTLGDVGKETIRQVSQALNIGLPAIADPLASVAMNYDRFRKQAIVDPWMEETLSANEQRNRYTSNLARGVADLANSIPLVNKLTFITSPMQLQYLMHQYTGTSGTYLIALADRIARTGILPGVPFDPLMNLTEAENVVGTTHDFDWVSLIGGEGVTNVPMLGDLLVDPRTRAGRQQEFYDLIQELDEVVATLSSITERDFKKGYKYRKKHEDILLWKGQLRFLERQMTDWRKGRDFLADRPDLSIAQKREKFENLLATRVSILRSVSQIMGELKTNKSLFNKLKPRTRSV